MRISFAINALISVVAASISMAAEPGQKAAITSRGTQLTGIMPIGGPAHPAITTDQVVRVAVAKSEPPKIEKPLPVTAKDLAAQEAQVAMMAAAAVAQTKAAEAESVSKALIWQEPPLPEGALFPDPNGIIFAGRAGNKNINSSPSVRNPWDIRVIQKTSLTEFKMMYGGLIVGDGKPIAFVNGEAHARGDRIGMFNLAEIRFKEAVLESNGTFYVLPEGRQVTVRVANTTVSR